MIPKRGGEEELVCHLVAFQYDAFCCCFVDRVLWVSFRSINHEYPPSYRSQLMADSAFASTCWYFCTARRDGSRSGGILFPLSLIVCASVPFTRVILCCRRRRRNPRIGRGCFVVMGSAVVMAVVSIPYRYYRRQYYRRLVVEDVDWWFLWAR